MELIDVHCHLDDERFSEDLEDVIFRFKEVGGKFIITSGVNPNTNRKSLEIMEKYPDTVRVSFGLYPVDSIADKLGDLGEEGSLRYVEKFDLDSELNWIEENKDSCVAIGEVGLDYKVIEGHKEDQKAVFQKVIDLSKKIDKPIVIHSRKAEEDAIDILEKNNCDKVLMHCFSGKKSLIKRCVELGWNFSVPAVIARLEHFKMLVKMVPLEQLMTETDGAYLSPEYGTRNEPKNIVGTVKIISEIKGLSEEEVAEKLFDNAKKFFGL